MSTLVLPIIADNPDAQKIELFTIEETGRTFYAEARQRVNVGLKFARLTAQGKQDEAINYLLEKTLGEEAYEALLEYDGLTTEMLQQIFEIVTKVTMGNLEAPKTGPVK